MSQIHVVNNSSDISVVQMEDEICRAKSGEKDKLYFLPEGLNRKNKQNDDEVLNERNFTGILKQSKSGMIHEGSGITYEYSPNQSYLTRNKSDLNFKY